MSFLPAVDRTLPSHVQSLIRTRQAFEANDRIAQENLKVSNYVDWESKSDRKMKVREAQRVVGEANSDTKAAKHIVFQERHQRLRELYDQEAAEYDRLLAERGLYIHKGQDDV
ncbi:hypothetical protein BLNAU_15783 [Blattamonas nauphoetae]|uniref:Flagellar FliJ protein n=1 Tax=Blattamonas nauphoetae TaxID=2049346 RepID=A0ABQ9XFB5_9EUKA|nr:hypothetical protein BLNAU_15783 [Blattamonas nauphoetae]